MNDYYREFNILQNATTTFELKVDWNSYGQYDHNDNCYDNEWNNPRSLLCNLSRLRHPYSW